MAVRKLFWSINVILIFVLEKVLLSSLSWLLHIERERLCIERMPWLCTFYITTVKVNVFTKLKSCSIYEKLRPRSFLTWLYIIINCLIANTKQLLLLCTSKILAYKQWIIVCLFHLSILPRCLHTVNIPYVQLNKFLQECYDIELVLKLPVLVDCFAAYILPTLLIMYYFKSSSDISEYS